MQHRDALSPPPSPFFSEHRSHVFEISKQRHDFAIGHEFKYMFPNYLATVKHCGKRTNCSFQAISPFPTVFSKELCYKHVKTSDCMGKV